MLINCPFCGNNGGKDKYFVCLGVEKRMLRQCSSCDSCWLPSPFPISSVSENYEHSYFKGAEREIHKGATLAQDYLPKVARYVRPLAGTRTLEIGAGFGHFAHLAQKSFGIECNVVEISESSRQFIERSFPDIKIVGRTLSDLPPEPAYDQMFCFHVLEHVQDLDHFLKEAAARLKAGGVFFALTPNGASRTFSFWGEKWGWAGIDQHFSFLSAKVPPSFFSKAGLELTKSISLVPAALHFPSTWRIKVADWAKMSIERRLQPQPNETPMRRLARKIRNIPFRALGWICYWATTKLAPDAKGTWLLPVESFFARRTNALERDELCLVLKKNLLSTALSK
jgi:SAM-dependent methyltransferase